MALRLLGNSTGLVILLSVLRAGASKMKKFLVFSRINTTIAVRAGIERLLEEEKVSSKGWKSDLGDLHMIRLDKIRGSVISTRFSRKVRGGTESFSRR